eukprot:CAMPEP_0195147484 /NCGR_PEP_ID=MMETSP0448-20130528/173486_1 /TAXON_ID=66468 /ORGANISM="Heterocapsa triquestra, Strain CCMP 448" /LENGTH=153 /DNA_ID=CAMNT_0040186067 /DNA_START=97 /DNA_END=555 /DNA_ORIENTATION=-
MPRKPAITPGQSKVEAPWNTKPQPKDDANRWGWCLKDTSKPQQADSMIETRRSLTMARSISLPKMIGGPSLLGGELGQHRGVATAFHGETTALSAQTLWTPACVGESWLGADGQAHALSGMRDRFTSEVPARALALLTSWLFGLLAELCGWAA